MKITEQQEQEIVRMYKELKLSSVVIQNHFKISNQTVFAVLKRNGVESRSRTEANRYIECNHHYFDHIDTVEKSYVVGLMLADGHVNIETNKFVLTLKEGDKYLLEKIQELMGS